MLRKCTSEKEQGSICILCCMAYFVGCMIRYNYAVCMVEIQDHLSISKSLAGLPVTVSFLTYGIGQLICGYVGDRISPQNMIFSGLFGSALCNLLIALFPKIEVMAVIWGFNGIFQSMLWPPMVRMMAETLDEKWYGRSCMLVSIASSLATISIYLLAPVWIHFSGWRLVFYAAAAAGFAAAIFWKSQNGKNKLCTGQCGCQELPSRESVSLRTLFAQTPLLSILAAIVLHGTLKDGIITWMPVYLSEMFGMNSAQSILSASLLPAFSVLSMMAASRLLSKMKNELRTGGLLFFLGTVGAWIALSAWDRSPVVCISMMMLITGCMYGVNLMLVSRVPGHFAAFGNVSLVSGVLNAATYLGSALSTYGFGAVSEQFGWMPVVFLWGVIAFAGTILMAARKRKWAMFCAMRPSSVSLEGKPEGSSDETVDGQTDSDPLSSNGDAAR